MDDNLMPNDGSFLGGVPLEPLEQSIGRKKEQAKTLESLSVLKEVVARLEERIVFYETTTSIDDSVRTDPKAFLILHNSYTLTAKTLIGEKEYIESLIDQYAKNR